MGRRTGDTNGSGEDGSLDDLFSDEQFREYDDSINPFVAPVSDRGGSSADADIAPHTTGPLYTVAPRLEPPASTTPLLPEEPRGPIHDRLSPTVAMPVQYPAAPPTEHLSNEHLSNEDAPEQAPIEHAPEQAPTERLSTEHVADPTVALHTSHADPELLPADAGPAVPSHEVTTQPHPIWGRLSRLQRVLVGVAAGAILLLLLAGLYALGAGIGGETDAADSALGDDTGAAASGAALEPGVHPWSALQGGECLDPFESAWAEEFTVVDCEDGHAAQFMHRGEVGPEVTVYLDAEGWQGLTTTLCDAGELLDLSVAREYTDLQWHIAYAGDATVWANGDRSYSCFIDRVSGEPLTDSLLAAP